MGDQAKTIRYDAASEQPARRRLRMLSMIDAQRAKNTLTIMQPLAATLDHDWGVRGLGLLGSALQRRGRTPMLYLAR
jgi:hypothetical protein